MIKTLKERMADLLTHVEKKFGMTATAPGAAAATVDATAPATLTANRDWSEDVKALKAKVKTLEDAAQPRPMGGGPLPTVTSDPTFKGFSWARVVKKLCVERKSVMDSAGWDDAPVELQALRAGLCERLEVKSWEEAQLAIRFKSASLGNATQLGGLIPTILMPQVEPINRSELILPTLGIRSWPNLTGSPVEMNRQGGSTTFYWTGENPGANFTESDASLAAPIQLTPKEAVGVSRISNRLLNLNPGAVDAFIKDDLMQQALRAEQVAYFAGTGSNGQPLGVLNRTTGSGLNLMNTYTLSGVALAAFFPSVIQMLSLIAADNNGLGNIKIVLHPNDWFDIQSAVVATAASAPTVTPTGMTGTAAVFPALFGGPGAEIGIVGQIHGKPVVTTTDATEGTMLVGDFTKTGIGKWGGMQIAASDVAENAFLRNQTLVRCIFDMDVGVLQPSALCTGTSLVL